MKTVTMLDVQKLAEEKTIQTTCGGCVFAECEETPEGRKYQTGCSLGRFEKLEEHGGTILNVQDTEEAMDFCVVQDRICNTCRGVEWKEHSESQGITDLSELVRKEISLRCTALIYLGPGQSMEDAYATAQTLEKQSPLPTETIIINNAGIPPSEFVEKWKSFGTCIPWRMEYVIEFLEYFAELEANPDDKEGLKNQMFFRCIDLGVNKVKTLYYTFLNAGDSIPSNYLSDIDKALNEDMVRFLALNPENDSHSGLFMQQKLHTTIGGNKERPCLDKVIDQTEKQECPNLVLPLTKIVKNFSLQ